MRGEIMSKQKEQVEKTFSRRDFLKTTGIATGGIIGGSLLGGLVGFNVKDETDSTEPDLSGIEETQAESTSDSDAQAARMYFKRVEDFNVLSSATEVIYPEDENGPGAIGLGVPYYIDKQLAGTWGNNGDMYMSGPFQEGETPITKAQLMLLGVRALNTSSVENFDAPFTDIEEDQQIEILTSFEEDDVDEDNISGSDFFELLRTMTIEGCYADPLYGGNKDMQGWKMKEYPGVQMSYRNMFDGDREINNEFVNIEPKSLSDYN